MINVDMALEEKCRIAWNAMQIPEGFALSEDIWREYVVEPGKRLESPRFFRLGFLSANGIKPELIKT